MNDQERIVFLARAFYLARGGSGFSPKWFKPGHKMWVHFQRLLDLLRREGLLGDYRTYINAQIEYSPDPEKVFPQMLYGEKALQKYQWYREKKVRRLGEQKRLISQTGTRLSSAKVESYFVNDAWHLEALVRRGMTVTDVLRGFPGLFNPIFITVAPEIWEILEHNPNDRRFSQEVRYCFAYLSKEPAYLKRLRELYDDGRRGAIAKWEQYGPVRKNGGHL